MKTTLLRRFWELIKTFSFVPRRVCVRVWWFCLSRQNELPIHFLGEWVTF